MSNNTDYSIFSNTINSLNDINHFLNHNQDIISFEKLFPDKSNDAIQLFIDFYNAMKQKYNTSPVDADIDISFARDILYIHIANFYEKMSVKETDYELKTKIKSLYIATHIIYTWKLRSSDFFQDRKQKLFETMCKRPDSVSEFNIDRNDETLVNSLTIFHTTIKDTQKWQTHHDWYRMIFYITSITSGNGKRICKEERPLYKQLIQIIERVDNPCIRVKTRRLSSMMSLINSENK